jgi:hypothetical protein
MSLRRDINNLRDECGFDRDDRGSPIFGILSRQVGNVVTIFTQYGGESGEGFTGLLLEVNRNLALLVTDPPNFGNGCCRGGRSRLITTHTVIPLNKIVSVTYPTI